EKFAPQSGSAVLLPYGEYTQYATEMNSWKLVYTADDNILALWCSLDEGATWTEVSSATAGEFSTTFTNVFGRAFGNGKLNFSGECEYLKIECHTRTKVTEKTLTPTYRWDFNDHTATIGDNDLTPSAATLYHGAENNYTIANGIYKVNYTDVASSNKKRPDLALETPFTLSSTKDWEIQWKCKHDLNNKGEAVPGVMMGGTPADPTDATNEHFGYIYIAPGTDFGNNGYPVKFAFTSSYKQDFVEYKEYRTMATEMNTYKLSYDAQTKCVTLYASRNDGGIWAVCDVEELASFELEISTLFGRMRGDGRLSFVGEMDYIQVSLGE
ncbi:MAG: hypothetical protein IKU45_00770, partial [Clostridia bacterium]|nr:hypothetical protein [Clostridia bacterium]